MVEQIETSKVKNKSTNGRTVQNNVKPAFVNNIKLTYYTFHSIYIDLTFNYAINLTYHRTFVYLLQYILIT